MRLAHIPQLVIAVPQIDRAIGHQCRLAAQRPIELYRLHHLHPLPIRFAKLPHDHRLPLHHEDLALPARQHEGEAEVIDVAQHQGAQANGWHNVPSNVRCFVCEGRSGARREESSNDSESANQTEERLLAIFLYNSDGDKV